MGNRPEDRLRRYEERQGKPAWGKDYQPAIRATPQEAPRISRPTILRSSLLDREVHLLSQPEARAAYLAFYHPSLTDLHEQKVLSPVPVSHPLQGSPAGVGLRFEPLPGTIAVAEKLGALNRHPKVFHQFANGEYEWVPLPYVGDLLLFLHNQDGPYCVNWNIKLSEADYLKPGPALPGHHRKRNPDQKAELRHLIEEQYYSPGAIRTCRVTSTQIDVALAANLRDLFGWHGRPQAASEAQRSKVLDLLRKEIGNSRPAHVGIREAAAATKLSDYDTLVIFYQGVWRRELRVDLFSPLLMTRSLYPESADVLERYSSWFER